MTRDDVIEIIQTAFQQQGLDPCFGLAICEHESGFNPEARSPVSATDQKYGGAWGLAQLTLTTAKRLGFTGEPEALLDPNVNIQFFCALTCQNISTWKTDTLNDLICMHNCGKPQYKAPAITIGHYLPAVLRLYRKWQGVKADPFTGV